MLPVSGRFLLLLGLVSIFLLLLAVGVFLLVPLESLLLVRRPVRTLRKPGQTPGQTARVPDEPSTPEQLPISVVEPLANEQLVGPAAERLSRDAALVALDEEQAEHASPAAGDGAEGRVASQELVDGGLHVVVGHQAAGAALEVVDEACERGGFLDTGASGALVEGWRVCGWGERGGLVTGPEGGGGLMRAERRGS